MAALSTVTAEQIRSWEPCWLENKRGRRRLDRWLARHVAVPRDALYLGDRVLPPADKIWLLARPELTPMPVLVSWAEVCALRSVRVTLPPMLRGIGLDDHAARCEQVASLEAAKDTAQAAARAVSGASAVYAEDSARCASWAAGAAARAAVRYATGDSAGADRNSAWSARYAAGAAGNYRANDVAAAVAACAAERRWQVREIQRLLREYAGVSP